MQSVCQVKPCWRGADVSDDEGWEGAFSMDITGMSKTLAERDVENCLVYMAWTSALVV